MLFAEWEERFQLLAIPRYHKRTATVRRTTTIAEKHVLKPPKPYAYIYFKEKHIFDFHFFPPEFSSQNNLIEDEMELKKQGRK